MALADTITSLGTSIINLVGTRAKTDLSNITSAGETVITNLAAGVPVGTVIAYMGTSAPAGFLLMDGGEYSKTTYADLYAVVGDSMGTATDSSKFVIADMTDGRYLMGSTVAGSSSGSTSQKSLTVSIQGNGKSLGLTDGTNNLGVWTSSSTSGLRPVTGAFNKNVGTDYGTEGTQSIKKALGIVQDASKSGLTGSVTIPALAVGITNSLTLVSKKLGKLYIKY